MSRSSTATPVNLPRLLLLSAPVYSIRLPPYSLNDDLDFNRFWQFTAVSFLLFFLGGGGFGFMFASLRVLLLNVTPRDKSSCIKVTVYIGFVPPRPCAGQEIGSLSVCLFSTRLFLSRIV